MSSNEAEVQITGVCTKNDFSDFAKNAKDVLKNELTSYSKRVRVKTCVAQPRSDAGCQRTDSRLMPFADGTIEGAPHSSASFLNHISTNQSNEHPSWPSSVSTISSRCPKAPGAREVDLCRALQDFRRYPLSSSPTIAPAAAARPREKSS